MSFGFGFVFRDGKSMEWDFMDGLFKWDMGCLTSLIIRVETLDVWCGLCFVGLKARAKGSTV